MSHIRFKSALACLGIASENGYVDLSKDEIAFLTQEKLWMSSDRNRARRIIEAFCYGSLDVQGLPRFPLPAEYIAAVISQMVHPSNFMAACTVMSGVEWTENLALQRENPIQPEHLFALVVQIKSGNSKLIDEAEAKLTRLMKEGEKDAA